MTVCWALVVMREGMKILNYLNKRQYHTKTVHPKLVNDLSFVISDIYDIYFVKKTILEQFLALLSRN